MAAIWLLTVSHCLHGQATRTSGSTQLTRFVCLAETVRTDDFVAAPAGVGTSRITVSDKLVRLKARCRAGKLLDGRGREIRFFPSECWGNPPADYPELQKRRGDAIARSTKKYTVIEIACRIDIVSPPPSS